MPASIPAVLVYANTMSKSRAEHSFSVRVIGGRWRGRRIAIPRGTAVRPTPDRVRETVFNWLADIVAGAACLDLFAGTGALGFEALSRGARVVWFVEHDAALAENLRSTTKMLQLTDTRVLQSDAGTLLRKPAEQSFDLVFLDPPYDEPLEPLLERLQPWLADTARVYVERGIRPGAPEPLAGIAAALPGSSLVKQGRAAAVAFGLLQFERSD